MTLTPDGYRHRLIEKDVSESLRAFGAVLIVGPKYCGKTWVASDASNSAFMMGGINEYGVSNKSLAESDICMALEGESPHMIDEWQEVPPIWDAVRYEEDMGCRKVRSGCQSVQRAFHPNRFLDASEEGLCAGA